MIEKQESEEWGYLITWCPARENYEGDLGGVVWFDKKEDALKYGRENSEISPYYSVTLWSRTVTRHGMIT